MAITSATVVVPAGCTSQVILGAFPPVPYEVMGSASWATAWNPSLKTCTQYTLTLTVPAPAVLGGTFDSIVGVLP